MVHCPQFAYTDYYRGDESDYKHNRSPQAEHMHWLLAKFRKKPQRQQVEIAIHKTAHAEFCLAVFAGLVMDYFLADFVKTGIFR